VSELRHFQDRGMDVSLSGMNAILRFTIVESTKEPVPQKRARVTAEGVPLLPTNLIMNFIKRP